MKTSVHLFLRTALALLLPILAAASPAPEFEKPPTLPAQVLAPASLLSGDGFRVNKRCRQKVTSGISSSTATWEPSKPTVSRCSEFGSRNFRRLWS